MDRPRGVDVLDCKGVQMKARVGGIIAGALFAVAAGQEDSLFHRELDRWCDGEMDPRTLELLRGPGSG